MFIILNLHWTINERIHYHGNWSACLLSVIQVEIKNTCRNCKRCRSIFVEISIEKNRRFCSCIQCVPSVISTQIYHSKLIKTDSGILSTLGKNITLATSPSKRLTGIIVCRSIDELLFMESSNVENVHFIQYKVNDCHWNRMKKRQSLASVFSFSYYLTNVLLHVSLSMVQNYRPFMGKSS